MLRSQLLTSLLIICSMLCCSQQALSASVPTRFADDIACILTILSYYDNADEMLASYRQLADNILNASHLTAVEKTELLEYMAQRFRDDICLPHFFKGTYHDASFDDLMLTSRSLKKSHEASHNEQHILRKVYLLCCKHPFLIAGSAVCSGFFLRELFRK